MTKWHYVLILFFIFPVYLFSQIEEAKLIEGDTVIRIDTIQIEKADTTMVEETVSDTVIVGEPISDPEEKKEFIKQDFYNDYLSSLPKANNLDYSEKTGSIDDTLVLKKGEFISIFTMSGGHAFFTFFEPGGIGSIAFRVSKDIFHFGIKTFSSLNGKNTYVGMMFGYTYLSGKYILDISANIPFAGNVKTKIKIDPGGGADPMFFAPMEITFYYKRSERILLSLNLGTILIIPISASVGIGIRL